MNYCVILLLMSSVYANIVFTSDDINIPLKNLENNKNNKFHSLLEKAKKISNFLSFNQNQHCTQAIIISLSVINTLTNLSVFLYGIHDIVEHKKQVLESLITPTIFSAFSLANLILVVKHVCYSGRKIYKLNDIITKLEELEKMEKSEFSV